MKLLIADDHAPIRALLRTMFVREGTTVFEAPCGAEAVRLYAEHRPDWVFMDLKMEPLSGLRATRLIRGQFPGARIIIVTSCAEFEMRAEAARAGAMGYVLKDNLADLAVMINGNAPSPNNTTPWL